MFSAHLEADPLSDPYQFRIWVDRLAHSTSRLAHLDFQDSRKTNSLKTQVDLQAPLSDPFRLRILVRLLSLILSLTLEVT